ncbi:response regulator [Thermomonas sp.]|uniref:response regulator n=1 Tax=Thermomonas sp. TaxID=1971895 RepID=UPI00248A2133|nr:response regulator [Thermomonas sp.]MDI1253766.1 response regulator [Thermomonas sp.]
MNERLLASMPSIPRILLVEDDVVSAAYLGEVVASLPAQVDVAGSVAQALSIASADYHALLLIDAHLPDGRGATLLQALRAQGVMAPALAHTAAAETALRDELLAAGFVEVLRKPLGMVDLKLALQRHLPQATSTPTLLSDLRRWDDAAALAALGGQRANVDALRGLFAEELPGQRHRITQACIEGNEAGVRDELHRLIASCGFVGAARLGQVVRQMQATPLDGDALTALQSAVDEVLASAGASGG